MGKLKEDVDAFVDKLVNAGIVITVGDVTAMLMEFVLEQRHFGACNAREFYDDGTMGPFGEEPSDEELSK